MKEFNNRLLFCYTIYILLFIGVALTPYPTMGEDGKILVFDTLYRSGLIIPFCINTILVICLLAKRIVNYLRK